ncbi:MAG: lycopene cyclase domain-containing protein [Salinispira sp.]
MKKYVYAIIPFLCFAGPFAMSFDRRVYFIQYIPAILVAVFSVGALYIFWDVIVTRRGHWSFNDEFVGSFRVLHLPVGEWLFFLLIPYCCLFLFEVVAVYWGIGTMLPQLSWLQYALGGLCAILAVRRRRQGYTFMALLSVGLFFTAGALLTPGSIFAPGYMFTFFLIFLVFLLIDGIYTRLPTIHYNENEIWGIRLGTIPLEDFLYNLSYIGLVLTVYLFAKQRMNF